VIGTWVRVCSYAADVESGEPDERVTRQRPLGSARVIGCRLWTKRVWMSTCGTTLSDVEIMVREGLAEWDGNDLILDGYDVWGERSYSRIRHTKESPGQDTGRDAGEGRGGEGGLDPGGDGAVSDLREGEEDAPHHCNAAPGMCHHKLRSVRD